MNKEIPSAFAAKLPYEPYYVVFTDATSVKYRYYAIYAINDDKIYFSCLGSSLVFPTKDSLVAVICSDYNDCTFNFGTTVLKFEPSVDEYNNLVGNFSFIYDLALEQCS